MEQSKIGIYVNANEGKVVRITSPYWIPEEPDWHLVTNEPNSTLLAVRDMIKERKLMDDPSEVTWGSLPLRD
jgi:adenylylsulfate kinase-like enzyme